MMLPRSSLAAPLPPATPSDAPKQSLVQELAELEGLDDEESRGMDIDDFSAASLLELLASYVTGPGVVSSPSDADEEIPGDVVAFDVSTLALEDEDAVPFAIQDEDALVNVIRYSVTFNGTSYTLLLSPAYINQVYIDDDGYLWNMGTSTINGRLFSGTFNPTEISGSLLYLTPCLGNNFSANYNYGSPNYVRRYYWSNGSLRSTDTYGVVHVDDPASFSFFQGDTLTYILIFLLGGILLCLWRKSRL